MAGQSLPGIQYWRGIREALARKNIEVITATVPASGSIEARAAKLAEAIAEKAGGKSVNIIAYVDNTKTLSITSQLTECTGTAWYDIFAELRD